MCVVHTRSWSFTTMSSMYLVSVWTVRCPGLTCRGRQKNRLIKVVEAFLITFTQGKKRHKNTLFSAGKTITLYLTHVISVNAGETLVDVSVCVCVSVCP